MEKSVKRLSEFSSSEVSNSEEMHTERAFFDIQNLPNEVILHIFKFLDLSSWKNGRLVCTEWDKLLCYVALFSRYALVFDGDILKFCKVFCQTKSFFPLVNITRLCTGMDLLKILDNIGKGVVEISLDFTSFDLQKLNLPRNLLSKLPKVRTLACSVFLFERVDMPDTLKTINLFQVENFIDRVVVEKLQKFNQETSKKIVVQRAVKIVDKPKETDLELIKVDKLALKIAKSVKYVEIQIMNNLEGTLEIDLKNIKHFRSAYGIELIKFNKREDYEFYLNHIHQMPNVKVLNGLYTNTAECFFKHTPTFNLGIETFISCNLYYCEECVKAMRESFPNLKRFIGIRMYNFDFSTLLRLNVKFEEIDVQWGGVVFCKPLLELPAIYFENLSNLVDLCIQICDSPNWKEIFVKFPQLPKLQIVHFCIFCHSSFENFHEFFVKCPNIKQLNFHSFNDFNLRNLVELLKLLPKVEDLGLTNYDIDEDCDGKEFVDAIAPFAKNLKRLVLGSSNYQRVPGGIFQDDEMKYLKEKIPTLKQFY